MSRWIQWCVMGWLCVTPLFADIKAPTDTVGFRFNWPATFSANVVDFRTEATREDNESESSSVTIEYGINGQSDEAGYWVENGVGTVSVESTLPPSMNQLVHHLIDVSKQNFSIIRVDKTGDISIPDFEERVSKSREDMRRFSDGPIADALVKHLFSPTKMAAAIQDQWGRMVQMWNGVNVEIGTWYQASGKEYVPQIGQVVDADVYFRVLSRVSCGSDPLNKDCVLIEGKSIPHETDLQSVIKVSPSGDPIDTKVVTMFSLVTNPSTLLPHLYQESRESLFGDSNGLIVSRVRYRYL